MNEFLAVQDPLQTESVQQAEEITTPGGRKMLHAYGIWQSAAYLQGRNAGKVQLIPVLSIDGSQVLAEFRLGITRKYILRNLGVFFHRFQKHQTILLGSSFELRLDRAAFSPESLPVLDFLLSLLDELSRFGSRLLDDEEPLRYIPLTPRHLEELMMLHIGRTILFRHSKKPIHVVGTNPQIRLSLQRFGSGIRIDSDYFDFFFGEHRLHLLIGSVWYCSSEEYALDCTYFLQSMQQDLQDGMILSGPDVLTFGTSVFPILQHYFELDLAPELEKEFVPEPADIEFRIRTDETDMLVCQMLTHYGDQVYNIFEPVRLGEIYRDIARERSAMHVVRQYFPEIDRNRQLFYLDSDDDLYEYLKDGLSALESIGQVWVEDSVRHLSVSASPRFQVGLSLKNNLLELELLSDEFPYDQLSSLLISYREKKHFYRLKDGHFLRLEDSSLETIAELLDSLHLKIEEIRKGRITLPLYRASYLDQMLRDCPQGMHVHRDEAFLSLIRSIKDIEDAAFAFPEELSDIMRPYQKNGYLWMRTLDSLGFGGILADDMGLGKTLQTIALFSSYRQEDSDVTDPVLVVAPASLIYNWESELRRFSPELEVHVIAGNAEERHRRIDQAFACGRVVLITSYDLLRNDLTFYENRTFRYQIIDEAQTIKNHLTKVSRAVRRISARTRFALTGTPIENRLSELWSIFDFLMPGFLYSYPRFRHEFETGILQEEDPVLVHRLQALISPFILRRMKNEVLRELPVKNEIVLYTGMEQEQRRLYDQAVYTLRNMTQDGIEGRQIQVLAQLMKLRQICCDPSLVYDSYTASSDKLETCLSMLQEAISGGHKVLLFSQFTSMLDILAKRLDGLGISYHLLTGSVSKEKRIEMVRSFHVDETPVFLISLKAGGTGLNLTAADIVIHFDPWWNIAAENQATDRAYRIGQKNKVTVYRLITRKTIEERILEMQSQKEALSDQIISLEASQIPKLSEALISEILRDTLEEASP